jgi:hypothetical protein
VTAKQTKIFGISLGVDPKLIVLALIVIAGLIYYFTAGSDTGSSGSSGNSSSQTAGNPGVARPLVNPSLIGRAAAARRSKVFKNDRVTLKLVPVDGSRGDVDPTLRLGLLERVKNIPPAAGLRNLFEAGTAVMAQNLPPLPKNAPKFAPGPLAGVSEPAPPAPPAPFIIPLKYYGFVKPNGRAVDGNRGFFMDGENILIGAEGDVLEKRFLIVALNPNTARLEDTQVRQGQDLPVTPEAPPAQ